jgi:putative phosphoribosyl transferase
MEVRFENRAEAGRFLATKLKEYKDRDDLLVLALPRGGVPVAYQVAKELHAPLDVLIVRKLGAPGHEELALGAIASGGVYVLNREIMKSLGLSDQDIRPIANREQQELERREREYRGDRESPQISDKTIILIDDGLATGATMWAAVSALRQRNPRGIIVAVPTASPDVCDAFRDIADDVICGITPEPFYAVGLWYQDFDQTTDQEVRHLLSEANHHQYGSERKE